MLFWSYDVFPKLKLLYVLNVTVLKPEYSGRTRSLSWLLATQGHPYHWRHDERDGVSNNQPHDCLFNRLSRRRSKKISKLRATGLCEGNSPVTGEFPAQKASNAENVFIWWRPRPQPRYRLCIISDLASTKEDFNDLCHLSVYVLLTWLLTTVASVFVSCLCSYFSRKT